MSETKRRDFLKTAGVALGGTAGMFAASSALAQDGTAKKRKIIGINGSHRAGKTCAQAIGVVFEAIKAADASLETELVELASLKMGWQIVGGQQEPDDLDSLFKQIIDPGCVGIVVASPIYCGLPSARLTTLVNRLSAFRNPTWALKNKIIGLVAVASARNGGQETILQAMMNAFVAQQMILAVDGVPTSHWGATLMNQRDSIMEDEYGVGTAKNLGTRVAELAKLV